VAPPETGSAPAAEDAPSTARASSLFAYLALYTLLRIVLVVVLTAVLMIFMPLIVALLFAIIVQLPLSWLLFAGPRRKVNEAIAQASRRRRNERDRLQAALRGDDD
jgi:MFS superfamily sulfate permease-like transporter